MLVIGAGPAGTMAASMVNKAGFKVKIIEKCKFPRFVIGESLLAKSMDNFEEAGVLETLKEEGFQVKNGALFIKNSATCEFDFSEQFTKGWGWTWQVPRADFDKVIADKVQFDGVEIAYKSEVMNVEFFDSYSIVTVSSYDSQFQISAKFIIDSSGYGRVLPKQLNLDVPSLLPSRDAIFSHFKDVNRPKGSASNRITAISHKSDVWAWVIPFSNGVTSCGFVGDPKFFNHNNENSNEKLISLIENEPYLKSRFRLDDMIFPSKYVSGYSIGVKQLYGRGYVLTGNSTEFLDPIFSAGVTFATESGILAGKLACKELKGEKVDWERDYVTPLSEGTDVFRTFINAWYDGSLHNIFFSKRIDSRIKKQICSVLAGYVWDKSNPFVIRHKTSIKNLSEFLKE